LDTSKGGEGQICWSLDEEVREYHIRRLRDCYQYLPFDGVTLKVKGALGVKKRLVLYAYGMTMEGIREMISFRQETTEG